LSLVLSIGKGQEVLSKSELLYSGKKEKRELFDLEKEPLLFDLIFYAVIRLKPETKLKVDPKNQVLIFGYFQGQKIFRKGKNFLFSWKYIGTLC